MLNRCRSGTFTNYCVGGANDGLGCILASDCPSGTCTKAGTLATRIDTQGTPSGALSIGTPKTIKLGTIFCIGQTRSGAVNGAADLPGPGATGIQGTINLLP
jgi:hypothetical protein